MWLLSFL
jgi:serine/threonine protein kinase